MDQSEKELKKCLEGVAANVKNVFIERPVMAFVIVLAWILVYFWLVSITHFSGYPGF